MVKLFLKGGNILKLYQNGTVWTEKGYEKLDFLVEEGKLRTFYAGSGKRNSGSIEQKAGLEIENLESLYVYPGLIDPHTHAGIFEEMAGDFAGNDVNETSSPAVPSVRAIDAINPLDPGIETARNAGVTTICVLPGSANVIGGEGVVIKTSGNTVEKMVVPTQKKIIKMAFGRNISWFWGEQKKYPSTRLGISALLREKLIEAQNYMKKEEKEFDMGKELLVSLLKKEAVARIHVANLEDIETISRVAHEFDFEYVLDHATALHTNPKFAKKLGVKVILGPLNVAGRSFQTYDLCFESVKILLEQGIELSIMTDAPVIPLALIKIQMWLIDKFRLDRNEVLKMFTVNPAKVLGIYDRVGSLEKGKDADFFIMNGDIFDCSSKVLKTYIDGNLVGGEDYENTH